MDSLDKAIRNMKMERMTTQTSSTDKIEEVCPICDGMGLVKKDVPVDHPDFGKAFLCECQMHRIVEKRSQKLFETSRLASYSHLTFSSFRPNLDYLESWQNQDLEYAFNEARNFLSNPTMPWLLFLGGYGTGKTHLAAAIGNQALEIGQSVIFMTVPDLLDHLRLTYSPDSNIRYDELFNHLKETPLLILDDLGSESPTSWANEKLFQLLNHRYVQQSATVITSNVDVEKLDARIKSRLIDRNLTLKITLDLPDYRRNDLQEISNLSNLRLYQHMTFENFDDRRHSLEKEYVDNLNEVFQAARNYAISAPNAVRPWLFLAGAHGCGKTFLAASIANYRSSLGEDVVFVTVADLLDYLRSAFDPDQKSSLGKRFEEVKQAELLVLDHFQLETATPWSREKLFQIIDYRYLMRKRTVITRAGLTLEGLDGAFKSRFADYRVCDSRRIEAPDYRGGASARRTR